MSATDNQSEDLSALFDFLDTTNPGLFPDDSPRTGIFAELKGLHNWDPEFLNSFYDKIVQSGFNRATLKSAFVLATIIERDGPISVRGAFYRAVSAGVFPGTHDCHYNAAQRIILKLRRSGCLSYSKIVDSTRRTMKPSSWSGLSDFATDAIASYRLNLWPRQKDYLDFFVEKDAMAGILEPIIEKYDVPLRIIRGDISETFCFNIAEEWNRIQKPICVYYLGDHDPSGLRIEQTLRKKMEGFCRHSFSWKRIGIVDTDFNNPEILGFSIKGDHNSKAWKTRYGAYLDKYGDRCVEIDALEPRVIRERMRDVIESHIDQEEWQRWKLSEKAQKESLQTYMASLKSLEVVQ